MAMNRNKLVVLLALLAAVPLAAACGGSSGAGMATSANSTTVRAGAPAAGGVQAQANAPAQAKAPAQQPQSGVSVPAQATVPPGTLLQFTARLTLAVPNGRFDATFDDVMAIVTRAGGYISGSNAQAPADGQPLRSGQATFQVPADRLPAVVEELKHKGTPQDVHIDSNDVSLQYVDLQARLRNAEAQRDVMLALMQQARTISDTIQVENQLGQVTGQIEQLKGQIAYLDRTTNYATLSVTIREAAAVTPTDQWGLQTAASQALHNFVGVVAFLIVAFGTLLPLLVAAAVLVLVGRSAWRRLGARTAG